MQWDYWEKNLPENIIFLSYRRGDSPGYVSRLETDLEHVFGEGRVFRDVRDIAGGSQWKQVIEDNLKNSAVLLLIIGPRWDAIWRERIHDPVNYVELELSRAHELGVPVIPVTLDGSYIEPDTDLKSVSWIRDNQQYDMSDKQGRWSADFQGLVRLLEDFNGLETVESDAVVKKETPPEKSSKKRYVLGTVAAVLALATVAFFAGAPDEDMLVIQSGKVNQETEYKAEMQKPDNPAVPQAKALDTAQYPDISGTWQGQDGTVYVVEGIGDGKFSVFAPGYASGIAQFLENMPNKFRIVLDGVGEGEFSVSNSGGRSQGWMVDYNGQKVYDTLVRIHAE